jgi:hypothetical protein
MIQKDYIMRMIEQLASALARVILNRNTGNNEEALSNVDTACSDILGFDSGLLDTLSAQDVAQLLGLSRKDSTAGMKCLVAARLVKEKADIEETIGKDTRYPFSDYQKALSLYLDGLLNLGYSELDTNDYYSDVNSIVAKLGNSIPEETMLKLAKLPGPTRTKKG